MRIMMNCLNGLPMIKKDIVSSKNPSLNNNFKDKKKELWLLMLEFLRKLWKPELERK